MTSLDRAAAIVDITQTLNRYMQAIDSSDSDALRTKVFHPDAKMELLEEVGVEDYCGFVVDIMSRIRTQHFLMNVVVDVEEDGIKAAARSYFIGYHRVPGGDVGDDCAALFGRHEQAIDSVIGGYYTDSLVCTDAGWRIARRKVTLLWQQHGPAGQLMVPNWL